MTEPKRKHWVFTLNNPSQWDDPEFFLQDTFGTSKFDYICIGKEVAASGTKHFQGYCKTKADIRMTGLKKLLPSAHLEPKKGTVTQAITYCKKDGVFHEIGEVPNEQGTNGAQTVKEDWEQVRKLAKLGNLDDIEPKTFVQHYNTLKSIARDYMEPACNLNGVCGVWIHGASGIGKTQYVTNKFPDLYRKALNKWWCGYQQQPVVVLDDVDPSHHNWIGSFLKIWADSVSFIGEQKLGAKSLRPKLFIVTSQYTINEVFHDTQTRDAISRRYIQIEYTNNADCDVKIAPRMALLTPPPIEQTEDLLEFDLLSLPDLN